MKKMMYIWGILIIVLLGGITYVGLKEKNSNNIYKKLENELEDTAKGYFGEQPGLLSDNKVVLDTELGIYKEEILNKLKANNCQGYVKTKSNMGIYEYKAYIKCNDYETKNYEQQSNTCTEGC